MLHKLAVCDLHLNARTFVQPRLQSVGRAIGQHIDTLLGLGIEHTGGGRAVTSAESEAIDAEHAGTRPVGRRNAQGGGTRQAHAGIAGKPPPGPAL